MLCHTLVLHKHSTHIPATNDIFQNRRAGAAWMESMVMVMFPMNAHHHGKALQYLYAY